MAPSDASDTPPKEPIPLKDLVPMVAVVGAAIFGIGWYMETIVYARFGVGSVAVPRESAVAAAVFYVFGPVLALLPLFVVARGKKWRGEWLFPALLILISGLFPAGIAALLRPEVASLRMALSLVVLSVAVTASSFGGRAASSRALRYYGPPDRADRNFWVPAKIMYGVGAAAGLVLAMSAYAVFVLPYLPPAMGGINASRVRIVPKEGGAPVTGYLILSDDKAIVFSRRPPLGSGFGLLPQPSGTSYERIKWDDVQSVATVPSFE